MPYVNPTPVASGNISPSRFVNLGLPSRVIQCGTNIPPYGVAQEGTFYAPGAFEYFNPSGTNYAAIDGQSLRVYAPGSECLLELGGQVSAGQMVKSDSVGRGVAATSASDNAGARALESGTSGLFVRVIVIDRQGPN